MSADSKPIKKGRAINKDNPSNQIVILSILKKAAYNPEIAQNGKEAINILEKDKYDIVLMDLHMPVMSGFEAIKIIRDVNSKVLDHDVTIIALTANTMLGDKELCFKAGVNDYISKPFRPKELITTIEKYLFNKEVKNNLIVNENKSMINLDLAMIYLGDDIILWKDLSEQFLENAPSFIDSLEKSIIDNDIKKAEFYTHNIKSLAATLGATHLQKIAQKVEIDAKHNQIEINSIEAIKESFEVTKNEIHNIIKKID